MDGTKRRRTRGWKVWIAVGLVVFAGTIGRPAEAQLAVFDPVNWAERLYEIGQRASQLSNDWEKIWQLIQIYYELDAIFSEMEVVRAGVETDLLAYLFSELEARGVFFDERVEDFIRDFDSLVAEAEIGIMNDSAGAALREIYPGFSLGIEPQPFFEVEETTTEASMEAHQYVLESVGELVAASDVLTEERIGAKQAGGGAEGNLQALQALNVLVANNADQQAVTTRTMAALVNSVVTMAVHQVNQHGRYSESTYLVFTEPQSEGVTQPGELTGGEETISIWGLP